MGQVIEALEVRLEDGRNGGVHITEEEDDIIRENAGWSLHPHLFHLESVLVQVTQIANTILEEFLSFL